MSAIAGRVSDACRCENCLDGRELLLIRQQQIEHRQQRSVADRSRS